MRYAVKLERPAIKALSDLPKQAQARIHAKMETFADTPRPPGCKPLEGEPGLWRIRVGDYRVVYRVSDRELVVTVIRVARRTESTYRGL